MVLAKKWAIGIDIGGTKIALAQVDDSGKVENLLKYPTRVKDGYLAIEADIVKGIHALQQHAGSPPEGIGIGMAGQIDLHSGLVYEAPNLHWKNVPLAADLHAATGLKVCVTNDVRAATIGEWFYGAGRNCHDLVCLFIGTGIGGGVVSGGSLQTGSSNTAGELGHITIQMNGPRCSCRNHGCLEALAAGWAIGKQAQEAVTQDPLAGAPLLQAAGGHLNLISAKEVISCYHSADPLAKELMEKVFAALIAGGISIVNAFNPQKLILGGGISHHLPELVAQVDAGIRQRALKAAIKNLEVVGSQLYLDAGVIGAATLILHGEKIR